MNTNVDIKEIDENAQLTATEKDTIWSETYEEKLRSPAMTAWTLCKPGEVWHFLSPIRP